MVALACGPWGCGPTKPGPTETLTLKSGIEMTFAYIPAGRFRMGSPADEPGRGKDETPHEVTITKAFYLSATEVTQSQWQAVMDDNPSYLIGDDRPVEHISWTQAVEFCRRLSEQTGRACRLPTEAEWEYACRARGGGMFFFGNRARRLRAFAWYQDSSGLAKTHAVGKKKPNPWGLYDTYGNVREWCADWYQPYPTERARDPAGPDEGKRRVIRGGSWGYIAPFCRSARREAAPPGRRTHYVGLRVAMDRHVAMDAP